MYACACVCDNTHTIFSSLAIQQPEHEYTSVNFYLCKMYMNHFQENNTDFVLIQITAFEKRDYKQPKFFSNSLIKRKCIFMLPEKK